MSLQNHTREKAKNVARAIWQRWTNWRATQGMDGHRQEAKRASLFDPLEPRLLLSGVVFHPPVDYGTGGSPEAVTCGDFDHDGVLDLVVANRADGTVSVLLGNGDGTFEGEVTYGAAADGDAESVACADFNGDGWLDLAVANYAGASVSILMNNADGTGTFDEVNRVDYATDWGPDSVICGDFNNDGNPDIAVANEVGGTVSILLNDANGAFPTDGGIVLAVHASPELITCGDFDNNGYLDLAVPNSDDTYCALTVLLNHPNGTFTSVDYYTNNLNLGAGAVACADFDADGYLDLAVADTGWSGQERSVTVLLNNGSGSFTKEASYFVGHVPEALVCGDFNGDGYVDIATTNCGDRTLTVLLGNGDGTFPSQPNEGSVVIPLSQNSYPGWGANACGDFNGDGKLDLAVAEETNGTVSVVLSASTVVGRHVFYNHSALDGNDNAINAADDYAIDATKTALLPGQTVSPANITAFNGGINGIMVDLDALANHDGLILANIGNYFSFEMLTSASSPTWIAAPTPTGVAVREVNGIDRVTLTWGDQVNVCRWLRVTVKAGAQTTGLAADDVFIFGNMPGDAYIDGKVDVFDLGILATNYGNYYASPTTATGDFNLDHWVDVYDLGILATYYDMVLPNV